MQQRSHFATDAWRNYADSVKRSAYNNWDRVLVAVDSRFTNAVEAGVTRKKHVACPNHGGRDGFRMFNDFIMTGGGICNTCGTFSDGFELLKWLNGWTYSQAVRAVGDVLGIESYDKKGGAPKPRVDLSALVPRAPTRTPEEVAEENEKKGRRLHETWEGAFPIEDSRSEPAWRYLQKRGLVRMKGPLIDMRLHPGLPYWENGVNLGEFPTLLALLRQPNGMPCTIQRIYLTPEGDKAPVDVCKKVMPYRSTSTFNGSAVRLDHEVGSVLLATEGVETGLGVRAMMGLPTWATTVAGLLENLLIPESVKLVVVFGDKDPPKGRMGVRRGAEAGEALVNRLKSEGRAAALYLPPFAIDPAAEKGVDWLDVLEAFGLDASRQQDFITNARGMIAHQLASMGLGWETARAHY